MKRQSIEDENTEQPLASLDAVLPWELVRKRKSTIHAKSIQLIKFICQFLNKKKVYWGYFLKGNFYGGQNEVSV